MIKTYYQDDIGGRFGAFKAVIISIEAETKITPSLTVNPDNNFMVRFAGPHYAIKGFLQKVIEDFGKVDERKMKFNKDVGFWEPE